jgi:phosphoribosyl-ATP pyrophosphohydrolase
MNNTYNKLEFSISMKFHSKNQIKKMKEENVETWPAKKLNTRKTLRGG